MSTMVYLSVYAAIIIFFAAATYRIVGYIRMPQHVRWELYPVAHEGKKASYGGGYLEETDWWTKPREKSLIAELKVMIPEILFLKAVWEHNRKLWYATFPFHFGMYLCIGYMALLLVGAMALIIGVQPDAIFLSAVIALTNLFGPAGFISCIAGAAGLFYKRMTDPDLKNFSAFEHYFNLGLFVVTMLVALMTWLFVDPSFVKNREIVMNLLLFNFNPIDSALLTLQILLISFVIAYIPLTHMSHLFMKYFLYHDIRWGDEPNIDSPSTNDKIGVVLNYPVSWSAPHIAGHGKTTWAEVATFNPAAPTDEKKE
ncbi:MAG: respiratory nitrate reductase subunit gamma [Desulfosalsimonadaceae bacterium]